MTHAAAAAKIAEELDVATFRRLWPTVFPHIPVPTGDGALLATLHRTRTQMSNMPFPLRAYSHAWLTERVLPSGLPDALRPKAERIYPVVKSSVGIATKTPDVGPIIRRVMENAVCEADADGRLADTPFVKHRMLEARERELKALFGSTGLAGFRVSKAK